MSTRCNIHFTEGDRVAAGLSPRMRAQLAVLCGTYPDSVTMSAWHAFVRDGLAQDCAPDDWEPVPTDFGREIARVLAERT